MPKKILTGIVVSDLANKTISVEVERSVRHSKLGKTIKTKRKYSAHDEGNVCKVGDIVKIIESRPISKTKSFVLLEKIQAV